jgi:uroporphyrinogen-III synthase
MLDDISDGDVVAFTSALAVKFFAEMWRQRGRLLADSGKALVTPVFAAASPAFVTTMAAEGISATIAPAAMGAGKLLEALDEAGLAHGTTVWLPRAAAADQELPQTLRDAGYTPQPCELYDTVSVPLPHDVASMVRGGRVDALVFLSGTCVDSVIDSVPEIVADPPCSAPMIAAIGRKTAAIAAARGLRVDVMPAQPTIQSLMDAIAKALVQR